MTNADLADEIEHRIQREVEGELAVRIRVLTELPQIIAALRQSNPVLGECEECGHTIVTPLNAFRAPAVERQVLVPREPTEAMARAFFDYVMKHLGPQDETGFNGAYRAMLSAAAAEDIMSGYKRGPSMPVISMAIR